MARYCWLLFLQPGALRVSRRYLAFSVDEGDLAPLYNLIDKFGINYPVLLAEPEIARSFGGVTGIPATFLVNGQGQILKKYMGYVSHDFLEEDIKSMLAAK
jgi:hypothetical protein